MPIGCQLDGYEHTVAVLAELSTDVTSPEVLMEPFPTNLVCHPFILLPTMKFLQVACLTLGVLAGLFADANASPDSESPRSGRASRSTLNKRQDFKNGEPVDGKGKGAPHSGWYWLCNGILHISNISSGGTNHQIYLENPANLGQESTDNGLVPNLKWSFSDSKTKLFKGGWVREQVITDLPVSTDIAAAQVHLTKGASRELHWHKVVRI